MSTASRVISQSELRNTWNSPYYFWAHLLDAAPQICRFGCFEGSAPVIPSWEDKGKCILARRHDGIRYRATRLCIRDVLCTDCSDSVIPVVSSRKIDYTVFLFVDKRLERWGWGVRVWGWGCEGVWGCEGGWVSSTRLFQATYDDRFEQGLICPSSGKFRIYTAFNQ